MFNHLCDISKAVFMENANFMIFNLWTFLYCIFFSMYAWPSSLKMKQFLIICIVGLQYYISYMSIT